MVQTAHDAEILRPNRQCGEVDCVAGCAIVMGILLANPFGIAGGCLLRCKPWWAAMMFIAAIVWGLVQSILLIVALVLVVQAAEAEAEEEGEVDGTGYVIIVPAAFTLLFCRVWLAFCRYEPK